MNIIKRTTTPLWNLVSFTVLLGCYLSIQACLSLMKKRLFGKSLPHTFLLQVVNFFQHVSDRLDTPHTGSISRFDLIELSVSNMKAKRTRTIVTIGGMAIGIATIVFLVSLGYGLQQLVVNKVARLEEMRQADVVVQTGGKIKINDKTLADFKDIHNVSQVLPLIAVVGRVNYQNSVSDMAVYGVTSEYLQQSAIKPVSGKIFESNKLTLHTTTGQVAGASTEATIGTEGETIRDVSYAIPANTWVRLRESPSTQAKIVGYTKRTEGNAQGQEVWGSSYVADDTAGVMGRTKDGEVLGKWIHTKVLLWKQELCSADKGDCEDGKYTVMRDTDGVQVQQEGFAAEINLTVTSEQSSQVLGISTGTANSGNGTLQKVKVSSESATTQSQETKTVELGTDAQKEAVVNRAMLKVLGIKENEAVGKTFSASFVVVGDLLEDVTNKIQSAPNNYTIVGVTPDEKTPVFYVPFIDLRTLGVTNFSQVKVVVAEQNTLSTTRRQIEAMGYITHSVADTVAQINSLFSTAKTILAFLGLAALAVAALGMFNTLTVSLLERTREVGLLKAMGMKSTEVRELFLTESMIMGFFGGILGILAGFLAGKLVGLVLSLFALAKGAGMVDISYVPFSFVLVIVFLSLVVGVGTGIFPARRATKISALNALRYE